MAFLIDYSGLATIQLSRMRGKASAEVIDRITAELSHEPTHAEGVRERLFDKATGEEGPLWLLQAGKYLVAFDVDEADRRVHIQSITKIERIRS